MTTLDKINSITWFDLIGKIKEVLQNLVDDSKLKGYTVSTLPVGVRGDRAYVTNATTPTYLGALVGGGTVVTPVFHNGTTWVSC